MVGRRKKVVWSPQAIESLKWHCDYIANDSVSTSRKVKQEIIKATKELNKFPRNLRLMNSIQITEAT
ncbi:MAG: type II toxin-antitoxin system RelE/ParE family toxin [Cyclobacteriaceae bacterium]|nr:type II toxin-antitoxin system RelE/ParE family toxin [Cyclobacteriaceae bacterium]